MATRTAPKGQQPRAPKPMSAPKRVYLIAYNALNAALWSVVLWRTAATLLNHTTATLLTHGLDAGTTLVYPAVGEWTKWTQTLAALEIVHSVLGESARSPPPPTNTHLPSSRIFNKRRRDRTQYNYQKGLGYEI